jgi:hypothetical protein
MPKSSSISSARWPEGLACRLPPNYFAQKKAKAFPPPADAVAEQEQLLMFGRLRYWAFVGALVTSHCAIAGGGASGLVASRTPVVNTAYLPTVGPIDLRFRAPILPVTNMTPIPLPEPVAMAEEPPPMEPDKTSAPEPVVAIPQPDTAPPPPVPTSPPSTPDPMISADQIAHLFFSLTNTVPKGTVPSMPFAPPGSAAPPPSTATYDVVAPPH